MSVTKPTYYHNHKCRQKKHEPCDNFEDNGVYDDDM